MTETTCSDCGGTGYDDVALASPHTHHPGEAVCLSCDGSGMA